MDEARISPVGDFFLVGVSFFALTLSVWR